MRGRSASALATVLLLQSYTIASAAPAWPMYQYGPAHNAVLPQANFRVSWSRPLGGRINSGLTAVRGSVYVNSFDRQLYALDASSGTVRWRAQASDILMSTPVVSGNTVIVGSGHNGFRHPNDPYSQLWGDENGDDVIAFDARTGARLWTFHTIGENMPSAAIDGDRVIFANGDAHAYGLDVRTGKQLWRTDLPGIDTMASITIDHGRAFVGTCRINPHRCTTLALDVRNGRVLWENEGHGGSDASATVADGLVFVDGWRAGSQTFRPGGRDVVAALDERTGRTVWEYDAGEGPYSLVASAEHHIAGAYCRGVLYQSISNRDEIMAFNARNGTIKWRMRTYAPVKMSPTVIRDRVYFGDTAGLLYDVESATGHIVHTSAMHQPFSAGPFISIGQTLGVTNGNNVLFVPVDQL